MILRFKYVVLKVETNEVFTFNGGVKASMFMGISKNTVYKNAKSTLTEKIYNGYKFCKAIHNIGGNSNRGAKLPPKNN